jgi:hypothetical protein
VGVRVSGGSVSLLGFGLNWERTAGDERIARAVLTFLEDRRLLFGDRHVEDEAHCVVSALECRRFLTDQITEASPGAPLEVTLKAMRAAFRQFVEGAGPDGVHFQGGRSMHAADPFSLALGDLRSRVGDGIAKIAWRYDLEVDYELARILPPADDDGADSSWLIGFDRD